MALSGQSRHRNNLVDIGNEWTFQTESAAWH
jgi:hypothetical protein